LLLTDESPNQCLKIFYSLSLTNPAGPKNLCCGEYGILLQRDAKEC
jgi:hypothetical protein